MKIERILMSKKATPTCSYTVVHYAAHISANKGSTPLKVVVEDRAPKQSHRNLN
jgi:hypothetical protein